MSDSRAEAAAEDVSLVKYKAFFLPVAKSPFAKHLFTPTITADVPADTPIEDVERMAREAGEQRGFVFARVEEVPSE